MKANIHIQLNRRPEVLISAQRSKSALRLDEMNGVFCPPISIGVRAVAYIKNEVDAVIQARIEGQTTEQIQALVLELIQQRKN